ncbi:MAG: DUF1353 domain-containing protein [Burkholderiaceae bacterium]
MDDTSSDGRGTWQLMDWLEFETARMPSGRVCVPPGFVTDFASVPRVPVAFFLAGDCAHRAAVVHDWLYTLPHLCDRATADAIFLEACEACNVPPWRRWLMSAGVRVGGAAAWSAPNTPQPAPRENPA